MKNKYILIIPLAIFLYNCSPQLTSQTRDVNPSANIMTSQQSVFVGFRAREGNNSGVAADYLEEIKKAEPNRLYSSAISEIQQKKKDTEVTLNDLKEGGYSVSAIRGYTIDWSKSTSTKKTFNYYLVEDTTNLVCISKHGSAIIDVIDAKKRNGKWHIWSVAPNLQSASNRSELSGDISVVKAIKLGYQASKDVFFVRYSPQQALFTNYVIAYSSNKKIKVISFAYGKIKQYDDIADWFKENNIQKFNTN